MRRPWCSRKPLAFLWALRETRLSTSRRLREVGAASSTIRKTRKTYVRVKLTAVPRPPSTRGKIMAVHGYILAQLALRPALVVRFAVDYPREVLGFDKGTYVGVHLRQLEGQCLDRIAHYGCTNCTVDAPLLLQKSFSVYPDDICTMSDDYLDAILSPKPREETRRAFLPRARRPRARESKTHHSKIQRKNFRRKSFS